MTNFSTYCYIEYTSSLIGFELTTLVVIDTDFIGSCNLNYHTITTTTGPSNIYCHQDFVNVKNKPKRHMTYKIDELKMKMNLRKK